VRAGAQQASVHPASRGALFAEGRLPDSDQIGRRVAVVRLHRRHDANRREPWQVRRVECLDVLDAMTPAAVERRVHLRGVLIGVERHPDRAVSDRVREHLPAPRVE
jgi:hypothetical protein